MGLITIRRATNADVAGVVNVIRTVFDEYAFTWETDGYHADLYDIEGYYDQRGDAFWVAEDREKVVGTVALELFPTIPGEPGSTVLHEGYVRAAGADCSLERLYVLPEFRKGGVGSALIRTVLEAGKEAGRTTIELWSDKKFGDAHRLYGRFGATVVGERLCDDPDQSPEWGLTIRLR